MVRTAGSTTVAPPRVASPIAVPANSPVESSVPDPTAQSPAPAAATAPLDSRPAAAPLTWGDLKTQFGKVYETLLEATGIHPSEVSMTGASQPVPGALEAVRKSNLALKALEQPPDITLERLATPPVPGMENAHALGMAIVGEVVEAAVDCATVAVSLEQRDSLLRQAGEVLLAALKVVGWALCTPVMATVRAAAGMVKGVRGADVFDLAGNGGKRLELAAQGVGRDIAALPKRALTHETLRGFFERLSVAWEEAAPNVPEQDRSHVSQSLLELRGEFERARNRSDPDLDRLASHVSRLAGEIAEISIKTPEPESLLAACGKIVVLAAIAPVAVPVNACCHALFAALGAFRDGVSGAVESVQDTFQVRRAKRGLAPLAQQLTQNSLIQEIRKPAKPAQPEGSRLAPQPPAAANGGIADPAAARTAKIVEMKAAVRAVRVRFATCVKVINWVRTRCFAEAECAARAQRDSPSLQKLADSLASLRGVLMDPARQTAEAAFAIDKLSLEGNQWAQRRQAAIDGVRGAIRGVLATLSPTAVHIPVAVLGLIEAGELDRAALAIRDLLPEGTTALREYSDRIHRLQGAVTTIEGNLAAVRNVEGLFQAGGLEQAENAFRQLLSQDSSEAERPPFLTRGALERELVSGRMQGELRAAATSLEGDLAIANEILRLLLSLRVDEAESFCRESLPEHADVPPADIDRLMLARARSSMTFSPP